MRLLRFIILGVLLTNLEVLAGQDTKHGSGPGGGEVGGNGDPYTSEYVTRSILLKRLLEKFYKENKDTLVTEIKSSFERYLSRFEDITNPRHVEVVIITEFNREKVKSGFGDFKTVKYVPKNTDRNETGKNLLFLDMESMLSFESRGKDISIDILHANLYAEGIDDRLNLISGQMLDAAELLHASNISEQQISKKEVPPSKGEKRNNTPTRSSYNYPWITSSYQAGPYRGGQGILSITKDLREGRIIGVTVNGQTQNGDSILGYYCPLGGGNANDLASTFENDEEDRISFFNNGSAHYLSKAGGLASFRR